jgi:hypothetical protein
MQRKTIITALIVLIFSFVFTACARGAPMGGWYRYALSYREQEGYAIVSGVERHYWLYDTYTYHNGDGFVILTSIIPAWVEMMGYEIDYDNILYFDPNTDLAPSVKLLMKQRGCDVSVTLVTDLPDYSYVIINDYDKDKNLYRSTLYPFLEEDDYEEENYEEYDYFLAAHGAR